MNLIVVTLAALVAVANSFPYFQGQIPNGPNIPNPCPEVRGSTWHGVGHRNHEGGGSRNPFGRDFGSNGFVWDECICEQDSDGDGKTNGEELGDPDCVWTQGAEPSISDISRLSHPGICEPVGSPECADTNYWLDCSSMVPFECDAYDAPDTRRVAMTIEETPIPAEETTYSCTAMEFPQEIQDGDFHMIGAEAIIDNAAIMHHLIVYACSDDENVTTTIMNEYAETTECGEMVTEFCNQIVYIWAIGADGYCFDDEFGVRLGQNGFKRFVYEFHWNNPELLAGEMDASGVNFYYTPVLREYDAITIFIGKQYLEIPPGRDMVVEDGVCPAQCTSQMIQETIYIPQIVPHMHFLGREMIVEHYRNGELLRTLVREDSYDYDSPRTYKFYPHIEVRAGDEIRTRCVFDSSDRDDMTFWGDATSAEMCIAITMYYPYQASMTDCWAYQNDTLGTCADIFWGEELLSDCYPLISEDQFWDGFYVPYLGYFEEITQSCDITGFSCLPGCPEVIKSIQEHPCFREEVAAWYKLFLLPLVDDLEDELPIPPPDSLLFVKGMASCSHHETRDDADDHDHEDDHDEWDPDVCIFVAPTPDVAAAINQAAVSMGLIVSAILAYLLV